MSIVTYEEPVKPVRVIARHEMCGGVMKFTGSGTTNTYGSKWEHICEICFARDMLDKQYPYIDFE